VRLPGSTVLRRTVRPVSGRGLGDNDVSLKKEPYKATAEVTGGIYYGRDELQMHMNRPVMRRLAEHTQEALWPAYRHIDKWRK